MELTPPAPTPPNEYSADPQLQYPKIQAQLDDIKSALYAVAEKVGKTTAETQALASEIAKTNSQIKSALEGGRATVAGAGLDPKELSTIIENSVSKALDLKLSTNSSGAGQSSRLEELTTPGSQTLTTQARAEIGQSLEDALEKRFKLMAQLETEILNRTNDNSEAIKMLSQGAATAGSARITPMQVGGGIREADYNQMATAFQSINSRLAAIQAQQEEKSSQGASNTTNGQSVPEGVADRLREVNDSLAKLGLLQATFSGQIQGISNSFETTLDRKLTALAELDAELLKSTRESNAAAANVEQLIQQQTAQTQLAANSAASISEKVNELSQTVLRQSLVQEQEGQRMAKLADQLALSAAQSTLEASKTIVQTMAPVQEALLSQSNIAPTIQKMEGILAKIATNQNEQNEVFSDTLTGLLDSAEKVSKQADLTSSQINEMLSLLKSIESKSSNTPDESQIARQVEREISRKLGQ